MRRGFRSITIIVLICLGVPTSIVKGGTRAVAATRQPSNPVHNQPDGSSFSSLNDEALWEMVTASGRTAIVGLKAPKDAQGVLDGEVVIDKREWRQAKESVSARPGVTVLATDDLRPNVTVRFEDQAAMSRVRGLPHVQFVEPRSFHPQVLAGCTDNESNLDPEGGEYYWGVPGSVYPGDSVPNNFRHSRVEDAWNRGARGDGVTVGVIDTGVFWTQTQLLPNSGTYAPPGSFSSYMSSGRSVVHENTSNDNDWWDKCNHGTRMASTITAPRDGKSMIGVAWRANLVSVKVGNDVLVDQWESDHVAQGIRRAAAYNARIIVMALGTGSWEYENMKQEIQYWHQRGRLFIAAAGTTYCNEGVIFPAKMPEVVAVTGLTATGNVHPTACNGPEVDVGVVIDDAFALGRQQHNFITMGGSSGATAVAAGVAAQIWSAHPEFTRDQVRERLIYNWRSGAPGPEKNLDAYRAVGGLVHVWISGPSFVNSGETYTLAALPDGDGPEFTYRWSTGETTPSITRTAGSTSSGYHDITLTVTDKRDGRTLSTTHRVSWPIPPENDDPIEPPCTNMRFC